LSKDTRKYPDENEIERILEAIHNIAWNSVQLTPNQKCDLIVNVRWVLDVWQKQYLGHNQLTTIIENHYLSKMIAESGNFISTCKELDLVICFFQHYIYAFEEFMTREFRDSVIRCGLVCERLIKRIAVAFNHPEILQIKNFEDRANKLMSLMSPFIADIHFFINRIKYAYSKRTERGAHDTGAAGILVAKSCISEMPIAYMEYLDILEKIGLTIESKTELIDLVNSTVKVGTTMIIVKQGEPVKPESILISLYSQNYFAEPKSLSKIKETFKKQGHNPPHTSLCRAIELLCKQKMLTKSGRGIYVQRTPPDKFFNKEISD
jgi:hypothetical protein